MSRVYKVLKSGRLKFTKQFFQKMQESHPFGMHMWVAKVMADLRKNGRTDIFLDPDQSDILEKIALDYDEDHDLTNSVEFHYAQKWFFDGARLLDTSMKKTFDVFIYFAETHIPYNNKK